MRTQAGPSNRSPPAARRKGAGPSRLLSRDPTLVVLAFAVWSFLSGLSLLAPGDLFQLAPSYGPVSRLGVPEDVWGAVMLGDAVLLARTALRDGKVVRAAVAALSGGFWLYFGTHVVIGGFEIGILSVTGCWEVVAGLGLLAATVQWAGYAGGPDDE